MSDDLCMVLWTPSVMILSMLKKLSVLMANKLSSDLFICSAVSRMLSVGVSGVSGTEGAVWISGISKSMVGVSETSILGATSGTLGREATLTSTLYGRLVSMAGMSLIGIRFGAETVWLAMVGVV